MITIEDSKGKRGKSLITIYDSYAIYPENKKIRTKRITKSGEDEKGQWIIFNNKKWWLIADFQ